MTAVNADDV